MPAGRLRVRVQVEQLGKGTGNGMGGKPAAWENYGPPIHAELTPSAGTEGVLAGRLASKEPVDMEIRASASSIKINAGYRAREIGGLGRLWNIKSRRESKRRGYVTLTAEAGGAGS